MFIGHRSTRLQSNVAKTERSARDSDRRESSRRVKQVARVIREAVNRTDKAALTAVCVDFASDQPTRDQKTNEATSNKGNQ